MEADACRHYKATGSSKGLLPANVASVFEPEVPVVTGSKTRHVWHLKLASGTADCFGCSENHLASATRELTYF